MHHKIVTLTLVLFLTPSIGLAQLCSLSSSQTCESVRTLTSSGFTQVYKYSSRSNDLRDPIVGSERTAKSIQYYAELYTKNEISSRTMYSFILTGASLYALTLGFTKHSVMFLPAGGGLLFGSAVGYWGSGEWDLSIRYGVYPILGRTGVMLLSGVLGIFAEKNDLFNPNTDSGGGSYASGLKGFGTVLFTGMIINAIWNVADLVLLGKRFKSVSRSYGSASLTIQPTALYAANNTLAPGVQFNLKF